MKVETDSSERIDKYISSLDIGLTRSRVQKLIEEEKIFVNGKPCNKKTAVKNGDAIEIEIPEPEITEAIPQKIPDTFLKFLLNKTL